MTEQNTVSSLPLFDVQAGPTTTSAIHLPWLWLKSEEPDPKTQKGRVLAYLREFGSITPMEAIRDLGCMRLGARIWDLKKLGYDIESDNITVQNRWGKDCHVARYTLKERT